MQISVSSGAHTVIRNDEKVIEIATAAFGNRVHGSVSPIGWSRMLTLALGLVVAGFGVYLFAEHIYDQPLPSNEQSALLIYGLYVLLSIWCGWTGAKIAHSAFFSRDEYFHIDLEKRMLSYGFRTPQIAYSEKQYRLREVGAFEVVYRANTSKKGGAHRTYTVRFRLPDQPKPITLLSVRGIGAPAYALAERLNALRS